MPVNYSTTVKNSRLQAVVDAIDGGASAGTLEIGTAAMATTLVSMTLASPCATVAGGVLTLAGTPLSGTATETGTAAAARLLDSDGITIVSGLSVDTALADIVIDSTDIATGQTVSLRTGRITHG